MKWSSCNGVSKKKSRSLVASMWLCPCHVQWTFIGEKMDQRFHMQKNVKIYTPALLKGWLKGWMPLKNDTRYENDVSGGITQGMQVLWITSRWSEPSTPMSKDEIFYRRIDDIYEEAVLDEKRLIYHRVMQWFCSTSWLNPPPLRRKLLPAPQITKNLPCLLHVDTKTFQDIERSFENFRETTELVDWWGNRSDL